MPFLASKGYLWPPTASMTSEIKKNYAYVITQDICNNFIEVNFCVGCMVSEPNPLLQRSTTMSLINKMNGGCFKEGKVEEFGLDRTFFSGTAKSNQN